MKRQELLAGKAVRMGVIVLLATIYSALCVQAETVTFTAADWATAQSLSSGAAVSSYTSGGVTVAFEQGTGNAVTWNGTAIIAASGNSMTVSAASGYAIEAASFTMGGANAQATRLAGNSWSTGSAVVNGSNAKQVDWTGATNTLSVPFTGNQSFSAFSFSLREANQGFYVTFLDAHGYVLKVESVQAGGSATAPTAPTLSARMFTGWSGAYDNVTADIIVQAQYDFLPSAMADTVEMTAAEMMAYNEFESGEEFTYADYSESGVTVLIQAPSDTWWKPKFEVDDDYWTGTTTTLFRQQRASITINAPYIMHRIVFDEGSSGPSKVEWEGSATSVTLDYTDVDVSSLRAIKVIGDNTCHQYTVNFYDLQGNLAKTEQVQIGGNATAPTITHECFAGWDKEYTNVHSDLEVHPLNAVLSELTAQEWYQNAPNSFSYSKNGYTVTASYEYNPSRTQPIWYGWSDDKTICFESHTPNDKILITNDSVFHNLIFTCRDTDNAERFAKSVCNCGALRQYGAEVHWTGETNRLVINYPDNLGYNADILSFGFVCEYYEQVPCVVIYQDANGIEIARDTVLKGESSTSPSAPAPADMCMMFAGWSEDLSLVRGDMTVQPVYKPKELLLTAGMWGQANGLSNGNALTPYLQNGYTISASDWSYYRRRQDTLLVMTPGSTLTITGTAPFSRVELRYRTGASEYMQNDIAASVCSSGALSHSYLEEIGMRLVWTGLTDSLTITFPSTIHGDWEDETVSYVYFSSIYIPCYSSYTVSFIDMDGAVLKQEVVTPGGDATAPADPVHAGYIFSGWDGTFTNVMEDKEIHALYQDDPNYVLVTFVDYFGDTIATQRVQIGSTAAAPAAPTLTAHTFSGWDKPLTNITESQTIRAQYTFDKNSPDILTVAQANALVADNMGTDHEDDQVFVVVRGIVKDNEWNEPVTFRNGMMTFTLQDAGVDNWSWVENALAQGGEPFVSDKQIQPGDTVCVIGMLSYRWQAGSHLPDGVAAYIGSTRYSKDAVFINLPGAAALYDYSGNGLKQAVVNRTTVTTEQVDEWQWNSYSEYSLMTTADITGHFLPETALYTETIDDGSNNVSTANLTFVHDINHDGKPELGLQPGYEGTWNAWWSSGETYARRDSAFIPLGMDLNRDGRTDYLILNRSANLTSGYAQYGTIMYQQPDGSFRRELMNVMTWDEYTAQMTPEEIAEMNNPGSISLGEVSRYRYTLTLGGACLARAPERGAQRAPGIGYKLNAPTKAIDLNGDGLVDLIDEKVGVVYTNMGNGKWVMTQANGAVVPADLNGDGITDFIFPGATLYTVIFNQTTNQFERTILYSNAAVDDLLYCYDFDRDGDIDILATFSAERNNTGYAYTCFFTNNGQGTFTQRPEQNYGSNALHFTTLQDLDGDGIYDLIAILPGNDDQHNLVWLQGQNGLTFGQPQVLKQNVTNGWSFDWGNATVDAEDLNGDGKMEVWVANTWFGVTDFYRVANATANTAPTAPAAPVLNYQNGLLTVTWGNGADTKTAVGDLTYALRIGTTPGGNEILAAQANADGSRRNFLDGNMGRTHKYTIDLRLYAPSTIYVAVQAIDAQHMGSAWSQEASVVHAIVPVEFSFTRQTINLNETTALVYTTLPAGYTHQWVVEDGEYSVNPESDAQLVLSFSSGGKKAVTHTVTTPAGTTLTARDTVCVLPIGLGESIDISEDNYFISGIFASRLGDYNADGRLDGVKSIYSGGWQTSMTVYEGTTTSDLFTQAAGLWNTNIMTSRSFGTYILWYDWNRDGKLDFMFRERESAYDTYGLMLHDLAQPALTPRVDNDTLAYLLGSSYRDASNNKYYSYYSLYRDLTHDGRYDFMCSVSDGSDQWIVPQTDGSLATQQITVQGDATIFHALLDANNAADHLLTADFDHDGFDDIAGCINPNSSSQPYTGLNVYYNLGNGHFRHQVIPFAQSVPRYSSGRETTFQIADFNGDGYIDLLVQASEDGNFYIAWNNANLSFSAPEYLPLSDASEWNYTKHIADFDNNGYPDILAVLQNPASSEGGGVYAWFMGPDGLMSHGFVKSDISAYSSISHYYLGTGDHRLLVEDHLYRLAAQADERPAAPTGINATMTTDGLLITWHHAVDDHTPAALMRYNLSVRQQGASTYLISPQNADDNAAFLPDHAYISANRYLIPMTYLTAGNYEISLQAIDMQNRLSVFSPTLVAAVQRTPIEVPAFACAGDELSVSYRGTVTTGTPVWTFDGAQVVSGSGFGPYTISWPSGTGSTTKTVSLTLNGTTWTSNVTLNDPSTLPVSLPAVLYEGTTASASVPEGVTYQWFAAIASVDNGTLYPITKYGVRLPDAGSFAIYDNRLRANGLNVTAYSTGDGSLSTESVTLYLNVTTQNGCEAMFSQPVQVISATTMPTLSLVTTDADGHNVITWDATSAFSTIRVYKEGTTLGNFVLIGTADAADGSYTDAASDATQQAERYRITGVSNGTESPAGTIHKTVHLTISRGVVYGTFNLIWNDYAGADVVGYNILRGASPTSLTQIAALASSNTSYTDRTPQDAEPYYAIEYVLSAAANAPSALRESQEGSALTGRSNVVNRNNLVTALDDDDDAETLTGKVFRNGTFYIIRGNHIFTIDGRLVK
ncbi:MAG: VCBS repeat-containing protein [Paludibacteraceae bacterium]|nr:VCBS repeat-containing protein [Paludibacteraceae bacterium]